MKLYTSQDTHLDVTIAPLFKGERRLPLIDILRVAMICLIVYRHVCPEESMHLQWIVRQTIMVLFIISGYLLVTPDGSLSIQRIRKTGLKILLIAVIAHSIYTTLHLANLYCNNPERFRTYLTAPGNLANIILVGDNVVPHLWYLNSYIIALLILAISVRKHISRVLLGVAAASYIFGLLAGTYSFITHWDTELVRIWSLHRTALNMAIPAILCGVWLRRNEGNLPTLSKLILILCFTTMAIIVESLYTAPLSDVHMVEYYIMSLPAAMSLVCFIVKLQSSSIISNIPLLKNVGKVCAVIALPLYLWHFLAINSIREYIFFENLNNTYKTLLIIILTATTGQLILPLAKKIIYLMKKKLPQLLRV